MLGGAGSPGGDELLTVTVVRDEHGYGMKVSGDNPVYVQSVKEHGAAWRAGLRAGDRILRVDGVPVHHHTHQQVVMMIRANPTAVLTVHQNTSRHKTPITAPLPVNPEKQRQLEVSKVHTMRLMLEQEQKYIRELRNELSKVPDVRKQAQLDSSEQRCATLQHEIDSITAGHPPQTDDRTGLPILHVRSQSSPEHLDHGLPRSGWARGTPPPGTPPPPYAHNTQPCADPQRAIISMEEDDSPACETSNPGLFSNLRTVLDSKARTAVLLNWLLGERRCACATLLLLITDGYRAAQGAPPATLRRWAYEIQSTFLAPAAVLRPPTLDPQAVKEVEDALHDDYDKEEILRNVFRKARQKAKEEMAQQLNEFQVKRQVGLGGLYGPDDAQIERCVVDKAQEQVIVERLLVQCLAGVASAGAGSAGAAAGGCGARAEGRAALLAALQAAALYLQCRPATVAAAAGGARAGFLQRDKLYKQRVKQLAKMNPQPFIVRGHHLQLQALTSEAHCHYCDEVIWGLAPQAYFCTDCKLRVHRNCAKSVEEACIITGDHNNRISRLIDLIHPAHQPQDDKKAKKSSSTAHFLNMERSTRKLEDEQLPRAEHALAPPPGESKREGSSEEPTAPEPETEATDASKDPPKDTNWRTASSGGRGVNRAESCRERDPPRRGKHRNASDPNRLTAHNNHDLEGGAATAPSGSSSSSSLSSRSNESTTVPADQQASQSDWSEEEDPLAPQWADSLPPQILDSLLLDKRHRKRQEVIHELIVSEGSHVRWLKVLGVDFLRPLEKQPSLLPAEELRALFPNLPGVRERHMKLYADLRALRNDSSNHIVPIRAVADAMLGTLGDSGYASCLSRFCRGQRLALETLRERRRKHKELHHFLAAREQLPRCGRLQLRDLLACVWQRLTKYQLLLQGIVDTVSESDADTDEDIAQLKKAHDTAKDVLQSVDTAIRTAENDHRLRTIQNKLEVRAGSEWEELRRLDLTQRQLRMEGDLAIRHDGNKKISVLALMLTDVLVLLQREGDKFVLRPIPAPSQQGALSPLVKWSVPLLLATDVLVLLQREGDKFVLRPIPAPSQQGALSPLVKWDKVLFRPNAAARNTFFLMNINGVQMHELSANTPAEYATWVKNIQECPLAKLAEQKPSLTPQHAHSASSASRATDDEGSNVSRNPSDASEKSAAAEERDRASSEREKERAVSAEREREREAEKQEEEKEKEREKDEVVDREDKHVPRRPTMSRVSTHEAPPPRALEPHAAVTVSAARAEQAHTAVRALTPQEQLRRLDEVISRSLRAKSAVVAELLGVPADSYAQVADLAVAEALGQCDTSGELRLQRSVSNEEPSEIHTLLLAALTQANQLTESLARALTVNEAAAVAARARGRCDRCAKRPLQRSSTLRARGTDGGEPPSPPRSPGQLDSRLNDSMSMLDTISSLEKEASFDMLSDLEPQEPNAEDSLESNASSASLAAALLPLHGGLQRTLGRLLGALPALEAARRELRRELPALRDANDALRHAPREYTSVTLRLAAAAARGAAAHAGAAAGSPAGAGGGAEGAAAGAAGAQRRQRRAEACST
ncbi:rho guanine nucleotide exchange factor 11 isoform X2 [Cydia pomonella]|uniref:rho guanine nucleotide exchange factor 11 isoform X2 n=1 Tax=Cydia pomonella TaxID=82600 RepID=UPI002ADD38A5|nr:rho guanine nucleotide exchange factor 11 isoform X2 [Cydia pomonella]